MTPTEELIKEINKYLEPQDMKDYSPRLRIQGDSLLQQAVARLKELERELVLAKGLVHDGLTISCIYCGGESTDYFDEMHKKGCKYLEAQRIMKEKK